MSRKRNFFRGQAWGAGIKLALLCALSLAIMLAGVIPAFAAGMRLENSANYMRGVEGIIHTGEFRWLGSLYGAFQHVKLVNQYGSNRQFWLGVRLQQSFPDDQPNHYLNLQIRRGTDPATLQDWYLGPAGQGELSKVAIAAIYGNPTSYGIYLDGQYFGQYSWYTNSGTKSGSMIYANIPAYTSGLISGLRVYKSDYTWDDQTSTRWSCYYMQDDPQVYLINDDPYVWWEAEWW